MPYSNQNNINVQKLVAATGVVLFAVKSLAWYLTHSVAVLTDALESTVNVVAGFIGLYSLYVAALPKDHNHPNGHGKIEFISAAIEGTLIALAGLFIIYESVGHLLNPQPVAALDWGLALVGVTAIINYAVGHYAERLGRQRKSPALTASGQHLQTDTYSTLGIMVGMVLLYATDWLWVDGATAIIFAIFILYTGWDILKTAASGIMDESDDALIAEMVGYLEANRQENWIDVHNLRIIKYGSFLHVDCHTTVPWYFNVHEAHEAVKELERLIEGKYGRKIELFVHTDGCLDFSCAICTKTTCLQRKHLFVERISWTVENISSNCKHNAP